VTPGLTGEGSGKYPCPECGEENLPEREFCWKCFSRLISREQAAVARQGAKTGGAAAGRIPAAAPVRAWGTAAAALLPAFITLRMLFSEGPAFIFILDHVNLAFHEAGHIIFGAFGEFSHYLGGTLSQLLWPLLCMFHFRRREESFPADLCLWWTGQNLLNISFYAADAIKQELPLVGGGVHDWTWLLTETGLISRTELVGKSIAFAGAMVCAWALARIFRRSLFPESVAD
jgi:hypothetical protein